MFSLTGSTMGTTPLHRPHTDAWYPQPTPALSFTPVIRERDVFMSASLHGGAEVNNHLRIILQVMAKELEAFYKAVDASKGLWKSFQTSGVKAPNLTPLQTYDIRFARAQENSLYSFELAWTYGVSEKNFWVNDSVMSGVAAVIGAITHFTHQGLTNGKFHN